MQLYFYPLCMSRFLQHMCYKCNCVLFILRAEVVYSDLDIDLNLSLTSKPEVTKAKLPETL